MIFKILDWIERINTAIDQWVIRWFLKEIKSLKDRLALINKEIELGGLTKEREAYKRRMEAAIAELTKQYEEFMNNV